ncbi:hypothetical protein [Pararhodobacter zhoushanensis]|uniref:hypothetical protein n=1 Tax=Pararhodobacter zhoushanensis TaxID=2479545 RepID=UPI000F8C6324|nr:hypothetical protein [Pararhodobacter zhoushanensis]
MTPDTLTPDQIAALFTQADGSYRFARWGRPIVPIVFGTDDATLSVVKGAVEAVVGMSGHKMAEHDPELGANLMVFFFRDWDELLAVPDLDKLVEGLGTLVPRLKAQAATQYRAFRFDPEGTIKAAFVFIRMDDAMAEIPAADLALMQAVQVILLWADGALRVHSPFARANDLTVLRPEFASVIRACYDRVMPGVATDASHALRVAARVG